MAAPSAESTLELGQGGLPLVRDRGLNTNRAVNMSGTTVDTSGNMSVAGTLISTGVVTGAYFSVNYVGQTTEAATDRVIFIAPVACTVVAASEVHAVAAGGASTLQLVKDTGTTAPGAGTDLLSSAWDLNATANTVQVGALTGTLTLAVGDRLALDWANAIQSSAGIAVTVILKTS